MDKDLDRTFESSPERHDIRAEAAGLLVGA